MHFVGADAGVALVAGDRELGIIRMSWEVGAIILINPAGTGDATDEAAQLSDTGFYALDPLLDALHPSLQAFDTTPGILLQSQEQSSQGYANGQNRYERSINHEFHRIHLAHP